MQVFANSPSAGYISWTDLRIQFLGTEYVIANGNTNSRYAWWIYGATALTVGNTLPTNLTDLDLVVFLNKSGTPIRVPLTTVLDGDLIVDGTILARHIGANQITATHLQSLTIDVADFIQSTGFSTTGADGWRIEGDGTAEFNNVIVRGITMANVGAFDNVVITGGVLRSQNYSAGSAGWRITGGGDAEFNNVTVRGTLASGPSGNIINVGLDPVGGYRAITFHQGQLNFGYIYAEPSKLTLQPPNAGWTSAFLIMQAGASSGAASTITLTSTEMHFNGQVRGLKTGNLQSWDTQAFLAKSSSSTNATGYGWNVTGLHACRAQQGEGNGYLYFRNSTNGEQICVGDFVDNSTEERKTNIRSLRDASPGVLFRNKVKELRTVKYKRASDPDGRAKWEQDYAKGVWLPEARKFVDHEDAREHIGLIAEEVEAVFPEVVVRDANGVMVGMRYSRLVVPLLEAVRELSDEVDALKARVPVR